MLIPTASRTRAGLSAGAVVLTLVVLSLLLVSACSHEPELPGRSELTRLVVVLEDPPKNLDPRFSTDATSMRVSRLVFSSLVSVDNAELEPRPQLARTWEADPDDPRIWTVNLRNDVIWHDGEPFDADDVVYTFESVMDPAVGSPFREPYSANLERVERVDAHTVRFHLVEPYATFVTDLVLGIVPEHVVRPNGGRFPDDGYIGTGPYRFRRRAGDRRMDLEAFPEGGFRAPRVKHLVLRTIRDEGTRLLALLGGSADLLQNGISPVLSDVLADDDRLEVDHAASIAFTYLALNLRDDALADQRVRQALALAIPRQRIVDVHLRGHATLATGMLAPFHWAYEGKVPTWRYDPDRARALLAEAGYPESKPLELTIKISTHRFRRTLARAIAQSWREVGVNATVRAFEFGTFFADIKQGNFQVYLLDLPEPMEPDMYRWMLHGLGTPKKAPSDGPSPYASADRRFLSPGAFEPRVGLDAACANWRVDAAREGTRNWVQRAFGDEPAYSTANRMFYFNPLVDCRLELGKRAMARGERQLLYGEVQRMVATELPVIPLWHPDVVVVRRKRVTGYDPLPNLRLAGLVDARLEEP